MRKNALTNAILMIFGYLAYTFLISEILEAIGIVNQCLKVAIADLSFLFVAINIYKSELKENFELYIYSSKPLEKIIKPLKIFIYVVASMLMVHIIYGIFEIGSTTSILDSNSLSVNELFIKCLPLAVFKTLIFAVIVESLVFIVSVKKIIKNDKIFILVSAFLNTIVLFMYSNFLVLDTYTLMLRFFVPYLIYSYFYIKENENIINIMVAKFLYNLIPLVITILTLRGIN